MSIMYSPIGGFLGSSDGKASAYNEGDLGSIPGSGRSPGEGNGNPFQYSCLENPMDGGAWYATVHGVAKSRTRLGNFTFTFTWSLEVFHCTLLADAVNCPQQTICVPKSSPLVEPRRVTTHPGFVTIVNAFCTSLIINGCCCSVTKSCSTLL